MGSYDDDFYNKKYNEERERNKTTYDRIIARFEGLTVEEKVDKLIKFYANEVAYK